MLCLDIPSLAMGHLGWNKLHTIFMVENGKNCRLEINLHYYASLPLCRPIGGFWQIGVQILQQLQL